MVFWSTNKVYFFYTFEPLQKFQNENYNFDFLKYERSIVLMKKYKYLKHVLINIAQSSCLKAISLSWFLSQSAKTCQSLSTVLRILDTNM